MIFKKFIFLSLLLFVFGACDSYKKVQQSTSYDYKYEMAHKYYGKKQYDRSAELFRELLGAYRGTSKTEEVFYYMVYSDYYLDDYFGAAAEARRFLQSFPLSKYAEEMQYLIGLCYMNSSPSYQLDQEYTGRAIDEFQLLLEKYPKGAFAEKANQHVDELQYKLERKAYETTKLYYKIGEFHSSMVSGDNFCREFPDSKHTEDVHYMMVIASYNYADKSIEEKQIERFRQVPVYIDKFIKSHPKSEKIAELEKIRVKSAERVKSLRFKLPVYYFSKGDYVQSAKGFDQLLASDDFSDKTAEIIYYKLKGQYQHALTVEPDQRAAELKKFRSLFDSYQSNEAFVKSQFYSEIEGKYKNAEKTIVKLPSVLGDEYYNLLDFDKAARYYYEYATLTNDEVIAPRYLLKGLEAELQSAAKSPMLGLYEKYQKIVIGFKDKEAKVKGTPYEQKASKLLASAEREMDKHPLSLFRSQYKDKQYEWVRMQAQKYLIEGRMGKYQDEIVYLWALSEYKLAKKSEKYERLMRLEEALGQVQKIEKMNFNKQQTLQKINKVELKLKSKIEKLTKRSHGLQKN
ncbi:MAG: outer membrane protein assembly factor BamD [Flavobacteriales bacterium]